jgi:hypothetical protein
MLANGSTVAGRPLGALPRFASRERLLAWPSSRAHWFACDHCLADAWDAVFLPYLCASVHVRLFAGALASASGPAWAHVAGFLDPRRVDRARIWGTYPGCACGTTIIDRAGRFAARRARVGQVDRPPLVRFSRSASLRRSPAAPFRLGGDRPPDHPATALVRVPANVDAHVGIARVVQTRPCGFWRLASPCACCESSWRRRPRGSFVAAFPSAHVPGPRFRAVIAAWPISF